MTNPNLEPRHKKALTQAYNNACKQGDKLSARYLREALNLLGVDLSKPKKVAKTKTTTNGVLPWMRPLQPSAALAAITGSIAQPRTMIVGKLWSYIKKHKLQDAVNKRMVNCDKKMQKIFGKDSVSMFEMAGLLGKHLS